MQKELEKITMKICLSLTKCQGDENYQLCLRISCMGCICSDLSALQAHFSCHMSPSKYLQERGLRSGSKAGHVNTPLIPLLGKLLIAGRDVLSSGINYPPQLRHKAAHLKPHSIHCTPALHNEVAAFHSIGTVFVLYFIAFVLYLHCIFTAP